MMHPLIDAEQKAREIVKIADTEISILNKLIGGYRPPEERN